MSHFIYLRHINYIDTYNSHVSFLTLSGNRK